MASAAVKKVKTVAIIGCGRASGGKEGWGIAYAYASAWRGVDESIQLLGVDINQENLERFATTYGLTPDQVFSSAEALYASGVPDVVSICTWPGLHAPMVIEAAEAGVKAIVCEKPMALSMRDVQRMLTVCRNKGAKVVIAHQRRFNPYFDRVKRALEDGTLGAGPYVLEARVADGWDILSWTTHWFDLANYLFSSDPDWLLAGIDYAGARRYNHAVENSSVVFAEYKAKHQAIFVTGPDNPDAFALSVRGSKGFLQVFENRPPVLFTLEGVEELSTDPEASMDNFAMLMAEVKGALEQGSPLRCDAEGCYRATEMALAVHESARTMKKVSFPLVSQFSPLEVVENKPTTRLHGKKILLYADEHGGGREGLAEALTDLSATEVRVIDAARDSLELKDLEGIDLLCLYHTEGVLTDETRQSLESWVVQEKPLALIHAALGAYPEWEEYKAWAGRIWNWESSRHPYEPAQYESTEGNPLFFPWHTAWLPADEVYTDLDTVSEVIDVLQVRIPEGTYPAAWLNKAHPHIAGWMPGHRYDIWGLPFMRQGLACLLQEIL